MNVLAILQLAATLAPAIKEILDIASGNTDVVSRIVSLSKPLASVLEDVGGTLFPKAAPALHVAAGAMAAFNPNVTKWIQGACNSILSPSPNLIVDGTYGPLTRDAVQRLQAKLGLKVDGWAGEITQAAIQAVLSK